MIRGLIHVSLGVLEVKKFEKYCDMTHKGIITCMQMYCTSTRRMETSVHACTHMIDKKRLNKSAINTYEYMPGYRRAHWCVFIHRDRYIHTLDCETKLVNLINSVT